jgi:hypothetical protein
MVAFRAPFQVTSEVANWAGPHWDGHATPGFGGGAGVSGLVISKESGHGGPSECRSGFHKSQSAHGDYLGFEMNPELEPVGERRLHHQAHLVLAGMPSAFASIT